MPLSKTDEQEKTMEMTEKTVTTGLMEITLPEMRVLIYKLMDVHDFGKHRAGQMLPDNSDELAYDMAEKIRRFYDRHSYMENEVEFTDDNTPSPCKLCLEPWTKRHKCSRTPYQLILDRMGDTYDNRLLLNMLCHDLAEYQNGVLNSDMFRKILETEGASYLPKTIDPFQHTKESWKVVVETVRN